MTKQEAIDETLCFVELYLQQDYLNDAQAARIGRTLFANLRQAERDENKEQRILTTQEYAWLKTERGEEKAC